MFKASTLNITQVSNKCVQLSLQVKPTEDLDNTILGSCNASGQFGMAAMILTSSMDASHILDPIQGFALSCHKLTGASTDRAYAMMDGEIAYRDAAATALNKLEKAICGQDNKLANERTKTCQEANEAGQHAKDETT